MACAGTERKHRNNPLDRPKPPNYHDIERHDVIEAIRRQGIQAKRILELGCGSGATGAAVKTLLEAEYFAGIERNADAARKARTRIDEVHVADIEQTSLESLGLRKEDFDLLLALDVLEHLYDPWEVLADLAQYARIGGHVILSLPNVQNVAVLQGLASGSWSYTDSGLLDATHLRFFTLPEIRRLVEGAGLRLLHTHAGLDPAVDMDQFADSGNNVQIGNMRLSDLTRQQVICLFTYQFVVVARKGQP